MPSLIRAAPTEVNGTGDHNSLDATEHLLGEPLA